ncbi:MAG: site-2 protease family protein [Acidimicrobiales bacterium]|nr:site-2 protease family protein [Acidimicrobiales bacterium]
MTATESQPTDQQAPPSAPAPGNEGQNIVGIVGVVAFLGLVLVSWGWPGLVVVLAIVVMIFMHELGHFVTAKWSGMKATEFFLGFGPRIWSFRRGETEYGLKAIPAGAYVKIIGMNNLEEVDPADEHRTYRQQTYPKRLLVAVAGSAMHFLMALVLLYAVLVGWGVYGDPSEWFVNDIAADSAAADMGLQAGDRVVSVDGVAVTTFDDMKVQVEQRPGQTVTLEVLRDGEVFTTSGTLGDVDGSGRLGVVFNQADLPLDRLGPVEAVPETLQIFGSAAKQTTSGLVSFFTPSGLGDFFGSAFDRGESTAVGSGGGTSTTGGDAESADENRVLSIFGAARIGAQLTEEGLAGLFGFLVLINITVGVLNLLPMLPLDGGHVVVATYERLRSRGGQRYHADVAKLLPLTYAVVMLLLSVGLVALWLDITDPVNI